MKITKAFILRNLNNDMLAFASDVIGDDSLTIDTLANYLAALDENITHLSNTDQSDPSTILEELIFQLGEIQDKDILDSFLGLNEQECN